MPTPVISTPANADQPAPNLPTANPPAAAETPAPAAGIKPVETGALPNVSPEAMGMLSQNDGGLGAAMWKGTSRALVERLLSVLNLPTLSAPLNRLAQRWLLTTAAPPEIGNLKPTAKDDSSEKTDKTAAAIPGPSLIDLRIDRLVALGDVADAWKLMLATPPDLVDELTMQRVTESALVNAPAEDACARLPEIMKTHTDIEWQKLLLVCQLRAKDIKSAQVTIDLLHTQQVHDEIFMALVEHNLLATSKQLPRQLTPLKPLNLALLQLIDLPLPNELYNRVDAALIPAMLQTKPREENSRLLLAEHAAERGLIAPAALAGIYRGVNFPGDALAAGAVSPESGARLHALLYQSALLEKDPQKQVNDAIRFMQNASPALLAAAAPLLYEMTGAIKPGEDFYAASPNLAEIDMLANKPDEAQAWLKLAKRGGVGMPNVAAGVEAIWPLRVLSGFESSTEFESDLTQWMQHMLTSSDPQFDFRHAREQVAMIVNLFDAMGFNVPDYVWADLVDAPAFDKRASPPTWLIERFHAAVTGNRRGEIVLLALLMNNNSLTETAHDTARFVPTEIVRGLRQTGLTADAAALAIVTVLDIQMTAQP